MSKKTVSVMKSDAGQTAIGVGVLAVGTILGMALGGAAGTVATSIVQKRYN